MLVVGVKDESIDDLACKVR